MPQIVSGIWGKVRTDDIIDRAVTRAKLEYPTEDVFFIYWMAIGKAEPTPIGGSNIPMVSTDSFTDKALRYNTVATSAVYGQRASASEDSMYEHIQDTTKSTADSYLRKRVAGSSTVLASESVDLSAGTVYRYKYVVSGSSLSVYRNDFSSAKISATDTDLASGRISSGRGSGSYQDTTVLGIYIQAPSSPLPKPLAVVEVPITGKGTEEDPIRPQLPQDLRDPKELGLNLNKPQINLKSVTWGAIDYKGGNTMIIAIYKHGAPYLDPKRFEDVLAIAKNKRKVPSNVQEAEEIWKELKKANPDMIAGKHTVAYHLLGDENVEPCSVADFYHGNLIQEQKIKGVPEWELRRTLLRWKDRLEKARISSELKDKHLSKLRECLKK